MQVYNSMPIQPIPCTAIYGYYDVTVDIGVLTPGTPYRIMVDDKVVNFAIP